MAGADTEPFQSHSASGSDEEDDRPGSWLRVPRTLQNNDNARPQLNCESYELMNSVHVVIVLLTTSVCSHSCLWRSVSWTPKCHNINLYFYLIGTILLDGLKMWFPVLKKKLKIIIYMYVYLFLLFYDYSWGKEWGKVASGRFRPEYFRLPSKRNLDRTWCTLCLLTLSVWLDCQVLHPDTLSIYRNSPSFSSHWVGEIWSGNNSANSKWRPSWFSSYSSCMTGHTPGQVTSSQSDSKLMLE